MFTPPLSRPPILRRPASSQFPSTASLTLLGCCMVIMPWFSHADGAAAPDDPESRTRQLEEQIIDLENRLRKLEAVPAEEENEDKMGALVGFARTTESTAASRNSRVVADRVENVLGNFININGYFRAGYGRNSEGGPQPGFKAPGAMAKYRLGNEAENFGELILGKNFYLPGTFAVDNNLKTSVDAQGPVAHVEVRMDFFNPHEEFSSAANTRVGLPEAWAAVGNVLPDQPQAKFWAGNRFYRRHDIGVIDFFFWNMSGGGGGIEDVDAGPGKVALAWIGSGATSGFSNLPQPDPENKAGFSKANYDLRWYDLPTLGGQLELGLIYSKATTGRDANGNSRPDTNGVAVNLVHTISGFISEDGSNKFSIQYGTEAAKTFTSGFETFVLDGATYIQPDLPDSWRYRVTENFTANLSDHFSLGPVLVYQVTDYGTGVGKDTWISAGMRPIFHYNDRLSVAMEAGWDHVDSKRLNSADQLYKLTVAPQVSLGGRFSSRPAIRAYFTYAAWGDNFVGQVGGLDYASKNHGFSFGMQMETWW